MSLATMAMFTASYITVNVFPVILDRFKTLYGNPGGTFLIFMGVCLACSLLVWLAVPETKDKTLEEIGSSWHRGGVGWDLAKSTQDRGSSGSEVPVFFRDTRYVPGPKALGSPSPGRCPRCTTQVA